MHSKTRPILLPLSLVHALAGLPAQNELGTWSGTVANERLGCAMAGSGSLWYVGARGATPFGIPSGAVHPLRWSPTGGVTLGGPLVLGTAGGSPLVGGQFGAAVCEGPGGGILVGEPQYYDATLGGHVGRAVVFSPSGVVTGDIRGLANGGNGSAGTCVAAAGDVDGDAVPDYLVGQPLGRYPCCPWSCDWQGLVRASSGAVLAAPVFADRLGGFYCSGPSAVSEGFADFPQQLCGLGDVNGTAGAEIAIGYTEGNAAWVYTWATTPTPGLQLVRTDTGPAGFGKAICSVGDVNGNGTPDYAVGAPDSRLVQVLEGADGTLIRSWTGAANQFGAALAKLGDQDGDGSPELVVGAPGTGQDFGEVCVFSLTQGHERLLALFRGRAAGDRFGTSVCRVPDQTGDGREELGIGAPETAVGSLTSVGRASLWTLDPAGSLGQSGHHGNGCVGTGSSGPQPRLGTMRGLPRIGENFGIGFLQAHANALAGLVVDFVGLQAPFPLAILGPTCSLSVAGTASTTAITQSRVAQQAAGLGWAEVTMSIPNNPVFQGFQVHAQGYVADSGSVLPGSMTAALWAVIQ